MTIMKIAQTSEEREAVYRFRYEYHFQGTTVQMPGGVPVATVAINGARNAGILAAQILSTADDALRERVLDFKRELEAMVMEKVARLESGGEP